MLQSWVERTAIQSWTIFMLHIVGKFGAFTFTVTCNQVNEKYFTFFVRK